MRRIIIGILGFGSLGLAATVGISWWLAIDLQRSTFLNAGDYPLIWEFPGVLVQRNDARPPEVRERGENFEYERMRETFSVPYWSVMRGVPDDGSRRVVEVATGWPLKTLRMVGEGDGSFTESVDMRFNGTLIGDLAMSRFGRRTMPITRLPMQPIWVNLVVSVAVWAVLCALVLNVPRFIRVIRWNLRREKKKCGRCGHDPRMQRSEVCTECGHDLDTPPRWLGGPSIVGAVLLLTVILCAEAMLLVQFLSHQPIQEIHWAVARGEREGVQAAIDAGVDVNGPIAYYDAPDRIHELHGTTPLLMAIRRRDHDMIDMLLAAGADPTVPRASDDISPPIIAAVEIDDGESVQKLLAAGANPFMVSRRHNVLALAARNNDLDMVEQLLQSRFAASANPEIFNDAIRASASRGRTAIVRRLLEHGVEVTDNVMMAGVTGNLETLELLIEYGGDVHASFGANPTLLFQVNGRDPRIWQFLTDAGVDIEARQPESGRTALHQAVWEANDDFVEFLLNAGADPLAVDANGETPRSIADRLREFQWRIRAIQRIRRMLDEATAATDSGDPASSNGGG